MSTSLATALHDALLKIDRPGSFCTGGSVPAFFPGLTVQGLGTVALPLTPTQARKLKKLCQQAPYGKGTETLIDTKVRRVWRLTPDHFELNGPEWADYLKQTVTSVQADLGLEDQKLESHLYDLLLYEPGCFFLPHRDGEKLDRMVATLVITLPSAHEGGELVVRHDGQERTIHPGSGADATTRIHHAAFYADCEHEVKPLLEGYRLCLVYNLTVAQARAKSLHAPGAPGRAAHLEVVSRILAGWGDDEGVPAKLAFTLEHQYSQEGLAWDALKGIDRARADILREAALRADCQASLALLTLYQEGGADDYESHQRLRRRQQTTSRYEMDEIYETTLTADHLLDATGTQLPFTTVAVAKNELVDPTRLEEVTPEENYEGYTGNEGMTLERWYRHGAVFLWPKRNYFRIVCASGMPNACAALSILVGRLKKAGKRNAAVVRTQCLDLARAILRDWNLPEGYIPDQDRENLNSLFAQIVELDEADLIRGYLEKVLPQDRKADPGKDLVSACQRHGWASFQPAFAALFRATSVQTFDRNLSLLERICTASGRVKKDWPELCQSLLSGWLAFLSPFDRQPQRKWTSLIETPAKAILAKLTRSCLAAGQPEVLSRFLAHAEAFPAIYPLNDAHVAALLDLRAWLEKKVKGPCLVLTDWIDSCCRQLEERTSSEPTPPTDLRRDARIDCSCTWCQTLKRFLADPTADVHRLKAGEAHRKHVALMIRSACSDLSLRTETTGSPHTLVCTKTTASFEARRTQYHEDLKSLAALRDLRARWPG